MCEPLNAKRFLTVVSLNDGNDSMRSRSLKKITHLVKKVMYSLSITV